MKRAIYLDSHATTPVDKRVLDVMIPYFNDKFGNPSSIDHIYGNELLKDIKEAREHIAKLINADTDEIFFTSGATEADNLVIFGIAKEYQNKGKHIITSKIEHKAILESCKELESNGFNVTYLDVDKKGYISLKELKESITPETILISIMSANNEVGTIQNLEEIGKLAKENNILFHTDAAQAFGNIKLDVKEMNIHLMSISGHKIYGPKGIGALYIRKGYEPRVKIQPIIYGGGQESNIRSGTLNVPGIIGLGVASQVAKEEFKNISKIKELKLKLYNTLSKELDVEVNGDIENNLAHNLNLYFKGIESKAILNLIKNDVAISAGSACSTNNVKPSYVITALGYPEERAYSSLRFGLCRNTTEEEIEEVAKIIIKAVKKLKMFE